MDAFLSVIRSFLFLTFYFTVFLHLLAGCLSTARECENPVGGLFKMARLICYMHSCYCLPFELVLVTNALRAPNNTLSDRFYIQRPERMKNHFFILHIYMYWLSIFSFWKTYSFVSGIKSICTYWTIIHLGASRLVFRRTSETRSRWTIKTEKDAGLDTRVNKAKLGHTQMESIQSSSIRMEQMLCFY